MTDLDIELERLCGLEGCSHPADSGPTLMVYVYTDLGGTTAYLHVCAIHRDAIGTPIMQSLLRHPSGQTA